MQPGHLLLHCLGFWERSRSVGVCRRRLHLCCAPPTPPPQDGGKSLGFSLGPLVGKGGLSRRLHMRNWARLPTPIPTFHTIHCPLTVTLILKFLLWRLKKQLHRFHHGGLPEVPLSFLRLVLCES